MGWVNSDGLYVKFGGDEIAIARGGEYAVGEGSDLVFEFAINGNDVRSTSPILLGSALTSPEQGSFGVVIPRGLRIREVELFTETAFTVSAGVIGSANIVIGLARENRSEDGIAGLTELDYDGITTTALVGTFFDATGETTVVRVGSTGAGALIGTTLAQDGLITVSNSTHGTNTLANGRLIVRIRGYYPYPSA